jgi:PLP dependent protein
MTIIERYEDLQLKIRKSCERAGRPLKEVHLIAVTKYVSPKTAREALDCGVTHLGENRIEGLLEKQEMMGREAATWHFIGSLQTRKVKEVLPHIDYLHSLDRLSLAEEIEKRADHPINCFVQVNVSGETSKHGLSLKDVKPFIEDLGKFQKIKIVGLMTMAPFTEDKTQLRTVFKQLKECQNEIQMMDWPYAPCRDLSMGMSNDFDIAIEEGATYIRVGTALVGKEF